MENLLREIDYEDEIVFGAEQVFSRSRMPEYMAFFQDLCRENILRSKYQEDKWVAYTGVKLVAIQFQMDRTAYETAIGKYLGITYDTMIDLIKCYVLHQIGVFVFPSIAKGVRDIIRFLTSFNGKVYPVTEAEYHIIIGFFFFIGLKKKELDSVAEWLLIKKSKERGQRPLAHMINYMAVDNELTELYEAEPDDTVFLKWFPVYFWAKITFILPLRSTEMLLTPYPCIVRKEEKVYLRVRRTILKKSRKRVHYNIKEDYQIFEYQIPDSDVIRRIERYQKMTAHIKREELFFNERNKLNRQLSLDAFNDMLRRFVETFLIGNPMYAYAKYAAGIEEFELITAGDSRPIAMANLFYQDVGADICRQLADHENISTSAGYYTNVSNTILASSIMQFQRYLNHQKNDLERIEAPGSENVTGHEVICVSPRQPYVTGDISDCISENCIQDCLGCRYYIPDEKTVEEEKAIRKNKFEDAGKRILLEFGSGKDRSGVDFEKLFLDAHTGIVRLKKACDESAKEKGKKWQRYRNTVKN